MIRSLFSTCLLLGVIGSSCCGADLPAFTDPDEAGTDFQIQGEYVGKVGGELSIGIQVIALGNYEFEGVLNVGGLPSAGWDESTVYHLKGKTADSRTSFHGVHGERLKFLNANFKYE